MKPDAPAPPAAARPRRMTTDARREQLLAAGVELFGRRPYDEVSIDEIASAAGISKGLLYHYFPTKRDFVVAVLREAVDHVTALTVPDTSLPPVERIDAALGAFLDYVEHHASAYAALFLTRGDGDAEIRAVMEQARERRVDVLLDGIAGQLVAGGDSAALRSAVRGWTYFVEGVLLRWLAERDLGRDELRALLREALIGAVAAAGRVDPQLMGAPPVGDRI